MPDNQDHADLGELLSPRERWSDADAARGATDARKPGPSRYRLRPAEQDLGSLPWRVGAPTGRGAGSIRCRSLSARPRPCQGGRTGACADTASHRSRVEMQTPCMTGAMSAEQAQALYELLDQNGVRCWVMGGWGVDALLGRVTREHKDLDLLVLISDLPRYAEVVQATASTGSSNGRRASRSTLTRCPSTRRSSMPIETGGRSTFT